jgi:single-strand DNA-binding protein
MVEGRLKLDQWEDKQTGQKRSRMGVVLESFQFLDFGGGRAEGEGAPHTGAQSAPPANPNPAPHTRKPPADDAMPMEDDDVPF